MDHKTAGVVPWKERCSAAPQIGWPPEGTMASFFEGVAFLTENPYPLWKRTDIRYQLQASRTVTLPHVVCYLCECLLSEEAYREDGLDLLYSLLIEPFELIHQAHSGEEVSDK